MKDTSKKLIALEPLFFFNHEFIHIDANGIVTLACRWKSVIFVKKFVRQDNLVIPLLTLKYAYELFSIEPLVEFAINKCL